MNDKVRCQEDMRARLDEWRGVVESIKSRSSTVSEDEQRKLNETVEALERNIDEGEACLAEVNGTDDSAWEAAKSDARLTFDNIEERFKERAEAYMH